MKTLAQQYLENGVYNDSLEFGKSPEEREQLEAEGKLRSLPIPVRESHYGNLRRNGHLVYGRQGGSYSRSRYFYFEDGSAYKVDFQTHKKHYKADRFQHGGDWVEFDEESTSN